MIKLLKESTIHQRVTWLINPVGTYLHILKNRPTGHYLDRPTGQNSMIDLPSVVLKMYSYDVENQFRMFPGVGTFDTYTNPLVCCVIIETAASLFSFRTL